MSSISLTLTSVSFFASSSAFWLPELCCAMVSSLRSCGTPLVDHEVVPSCRTPGTRSPSPSCSPQSPSAPRFLRPLLASCGLGRSDTWFGEGFWELFTFSCWLDVSSDLGFLRQALSYPAGQSSVHLARPGECVSCAEVIVGWCSYVEQGLDTRGVLGGLYTC
jgi:hypothetical protein